MCECSLCNLSRKINKFFPNLNTEQSDVIDELWNRMECAEVDLEIIEAKNNGSWPVMGIKQLKNSACQILMII